MGKKLKLAIIGMLGFSTACSTAKKSEKSSEPVEGPKVEESVPAIQVMYGVRRPYPVTNAIPLDGTDKNETPANDGKNGPQAE